MMPTRRQVRNTNEQKKEEEAKWQAKNRQKRLFKPRKVIRRNDIIVNVSYKKIKLEADYEDSTMAKEEHIITEPLTSHDKQDLNAAEYEFIVKDELDISNNVSGEQAFKHENAAFQLNSFKKIDGSKNQIIFINDFEVNTSIDGESNEEKYNNNSAKTNEIYSNYSVQTNMKNLEDILGHLNDLNRVLQSQLGDVMAGNQQLKATDVQVNKMAEKIKNLESQLLESCQSQNSSSDVAEVPDGLEDTMEAERNFLNSKRNEDKSDSNQVEIAHDATNTNQEVVVTVIEGESNLECNQNAHDAVTDCSENIVGPNKTKERNVTNGLEENCAEKEFQLSHHEAQIRDLKKEIKLKDIQQAKQNIAMTRDFNDQLKQKDIIIEELKEKIKLLKDLQVSNKRKATGDVRVSSSSPLGRSFVQECPFTSSSNNLVLEPVTTITLDYGILGHVARSDTISGSEERGSPKIVEQKQRRCLLPGSSGVSQLDCCLTPSQNIHSGLVGNYENGHAVGKNMNAQSNQNVMHLFQKLKQLPDPLQKKPSDSTQISQLQSIDVIQSNRENDGSVKSASTEVRVLGEALSQEFHPTNQEDTERRSKRGRRPSLRKQALLSKDLETSASKYLKRVTGTPKVQTKKLVYNCDVCGKVYPQKSYLDIHMRKHTGEKRYECNICHVRFVQQSNLKRHRRIHSGEKPFECDICYKKFARSFTLLDHVRVHLGQLPFKCDICNESFLRRWRLEDHQKIHLN